jgi:hypothetical protein
MEIGPVEWRCQKRQTPPQRGLSTRRRIEESGGYFHFAYIITDAGGWSRYQRHQAHQRRDRDPVYI